MSEAFAPRDPDWNLARLAEYDAGRDFTRKAVRAACYSPFVSLYFDTLGQVRACCHNHTHSLGHLGSQSLDEIWNGDAVRKLRESLVHYDMRMGCEFCRWQINDGHAEPMSKVQFDWFDVETSAPRWPAQMEFSISNVCNLECIMCNGEQSSAIRARRERLPPLPKYYDDRFFADLRKYLPHLRMAQFVGGEPFLARENFRVWDMMIEEGLSTRIKVTTNGTHYNSQVERVLEHLPTDITVSMDAASKELLERIRVNVRHEELLANFRRFHAYARAHGRELGINFTLIRQNWQELGDFLLFADEWQCPVFVCTAYQPADCCPFNMPAAELKRMVESLERQSPRMESELTLNRQVWLDTVARLRAAIREDGSLSADFAFGSFVELFGDPPVEENAVEDARRRLEEWGQGRPVSRAILNLEEQILEIDGADFGGVPADRCVGRFVHAILSLIRVERGPMYRVLKWATKPPIDRSILFTSPSSESTYVRMIALPRHDAAGVLCGTQLLLATTPRLGPEPISISVASSDHG